MLYHEKLEQAKLFKEEYLAGFDRVIKQRQAEHLVLRSEYIKDIFHDQERYRNELKALIGWPLCQPREGVPETRFTLLSEEDTHTLYRVSFEILDDLWMTGLFFKAEGTHPLVLVQHGGEGTPEGISNLYGTTYNYHHMLERVIQHGVHAFAPQLLLWKEETHQVNYNRDTIDASLKRLGSSVAAVELYGIQRIMDYFEQTDYVSTFGMVGLSYGGFYTMHTSALDPRIRSAISCAHFNTRDWFPWPSMTWFGEAEKFDDAEIACLSYPRPLCLLIGDHDDLFTPEGGLWSGERLKELCGDKLEQFITFATYNGGHEFCKEDRYIEKLIQDLTAE